MVIEISKTPEEEAAEEQANIQDKLVVICRMCNQNFTPGILECPYLYHPDLGIHVPMCEACRKLLREEAAGND